MEKINNDLVIKARIVRMNKNSIILELRCDKQVYVTRRVLNAITADPEIPIYIVSRDFNGVITDWLAVPFTM